MRLKFPESLRNHVGHINDSGDIQIVADFFPDEGYDYSKLDFDPNFNGASSDARRLKENPEALPTVKY
jgi:hypothetical protein